MELQIARQIIDTLAQGIHPVTGEAMPEDSPYNAPPVIRALFAVSQALQDPPVRQRREPPSNAGKPWRDDEDAQLASAFDAGTEGAMINPSVRQRSASASLISLLTSSSELPITIW